MCAHQGRTNPFENRSVEVEAEELLAAGTPVEVPNILAAACAAAAAIAIETQDLNLEEKSRESIHNAKNIVILGIDDSMRLAAIWRV